MEKVINSLSQSKSVTGGTSLITVYIPSNTDLWLSSSMLNSELSTAHNIKSKSVRKGVIAALKTCIYKLKSYNKHTAPDNGLVLCAGDIINTYF